ncbi:MAG: FecR family protein [Syntrophothermus sp.]
MNNLPTYENDLITRFLSGEATPEEIRQLSHWLMENPEHRKIFEEYELISNAVNQDIAEQIDLNEEWNHFEEKIQGKQNIRQNLNLKKYLRVAAILLALLVPAWFIFHFLNSPDEKELLASNTILEDELPDGTKVTLNAGSAIKYLADKGKERGVSLSGQAYFRVAHDKKRPFIVTGKDVLIEVLGTSFLVNTNASGGSFEVILDTGQVIIYRKGSNQEKIFLKPGERAISNGSMISVSTNTDRNYLAWKTRRMVFENDSLSTIITTIEETYGGNIFLSDPALGSCRVSATFDHQSEESVLNVLKETLSLSLEKNEKGFVLSGKGCNQ